MKKMNLTHLFLLAICTATPVLATNTLLGLRYPLGVPVNPGTGMSTSMGGAMTGVATDNNLMLGNPANLGNLSKTVFALYAGLEFNNLQSVSDGAVSTSMGFSPSQISLGIPMGILGAIGLSYQKRSDMYAHYQYTKRMSSPLTGLDSVSFEYSRDGGQIAWMGGWGYSIGKWAQLGITYQRQYMIVREQNRTVNHDGSFVEITNDSSHISMPADGLGGGIMLPLVNFFPAVNATIGLSGEYFLNATARRTERLRALATTLYQNTADISIKLPPSLRQGISWQVSPEFLAALDVKETFWSRYNGGDAFLATDRTTAMGVSAGMQYIPSPNLLLPRYWEIIRFRAGVRYDQLPAQSASEWGATIGLGLPLPEGSGVLDILVEYSQRRDTNWGNYKEDLIKIGFGLNGGRKWAKADQGNY